MKKVFSVLMFLAVLFMMLPVSANYEGKRIATQDIDSEKDFIVVDIDNQQISMYLGGELLISGPVVTGTADTERETPRGVFSIRYKDYDVTLEGDGYSSFVNYWMPIYRGIGIHDADGWRDEYGGDIYKTNGSHGCINVPLYIAEIIYENTYEGMIVIVK